MVKTVAIVVLVGCCYQLGYNQSLKLINQVKLLDEIEKMFVYIKNNITYVATPLSEIFYDMAGSKEFEKLDFVKTCNDSLQKGEKFSGAFCKAVGKTELPLADEHKELLLSFGRQLGDSDTEGELNKLTFYSNSLSALNKEAREKRDKTAKLYTSLGVFGGLAIALILL